MKILFDIIAGVVVGWLIVKIPGDALSKNKLFQDYMKRKYEK